MSDKPSIDSLFCSAIEIESPDERRAFVERVCGQDTELKQQVERLLHAHFHGRSILDAPVQPVATVDEPHQETAGTTIGPYKLLEPIGEGGMGTVWMAQQQEPVKRLVALKLIKAGMDSKQVIARFEAERQALALMDHPNIARVLDGGNTSAGRPYFVMDLVKGVPITKYCDEHRLTPRQRLELFLPVCQAVQHAHQKGIIHRDLKPSNVLVALYDGRPVPKVIDFGVAKAAGQPLTDQTLVTGFGAIVGTLEYMSPEQAEINQLDIDTRSDIYALGVLLYELLTGSPPFTRKELTQAGMLEMLRVIREQEPSKPSTKLSTAEGLPTLAANRGTEPAKLTKLVRGELDWIVMKALEKDRNRRYETANGFAMDVQRYLADEPVQACPPSAGYRLRKFGWRNKRTLVTAALLGVMLLAAVGAVGWAMRDREAREQDLARKVERDLALTEQGVRQAVEQAAKIRSELHGVLTKPGGVQELLNQPGRWNYLIQAAQSELAQTRRLAARAERGLSAESAQAMHKLEEQLSGDEADRLLALRLEKIRLDQATWVEGSFDYRKAAAEYPQAFAGFAVLKEDAAAVAARLRSSPINEQLMAALDNWALVAFSLRNDPLAEQLLAVSRQAAADPAWADRLRQLKVWRDQEALRKLVEEAPVTRLSPEVLALVGNSLPYQSTLQKSWLRHAQALYPADFWLNFDLANALLQAQPLEAAGFYRVALAIRPTNSAAYTNLGNALRGQNKLPEAIDAYHKAIELDPKHALAYNALGATLADQKKLDEAIAAFRKAIELDPKYGNAHSNLGNALRQRKKLDEAIEACRKAIELDPNDAKAYHNLGSVLFDQRKLPDAIAAYRKAIEINPRFSSAYNNLGRTLLEQEKLDEAIAAFRKAIEVDPKFAVWHKNLGTALQKQNRLPEAIVAFQKAVQFDPRSSETWFCLGIALRRHKKLDEAIAAYRKAIELDPKTHRAHYDLGIALRSKQKLAEAVTANSKAIELEPGFAEAHCNLGHSLLDLGQFARALKALQKGHELGSRRPGWPYHSAQWIKNCEHLLALEKRLPDVLRGEPAAPAEQFRLADLCLRYKQRYGDAVRLYGKAFAAEPKLAENLNQPHRYNAARAAVLAARGEEVGADKLNATDKARFRGQALDWLLADVAARGKLLADNPATAGPIQNDLQRWLDDPDLGSVREVKELAELPRKEREAWMKLWMDVPDLMGRATKE